MSSVAHYKCAMFFCSAMMPKKDKDAQQEEDFYQRMGISRNATSEEVRKAYKLLSLRYHPDKIAQRAATQASEEGKTQEEIQEEAQLKFQQIKEAYDTLIDVQKRKLYNAAGHQNMSILNNPSQMGQKEVVQNLRDSTFGEKSKLMMAMLFPIMLIILPLILICVNVDKTSESEWSWVLTLIPLWFLDGVVILSMVYGMSYFVVAARSVEDADEEDGQAKKPSAATIRRKNRYSISDEDDVDAKREANYASARDIAINLLQFVSIVTVQVLVALKLDTVIDWDYVLIFIPLYIFKAVNFAQNFYSIHTVKSDLDRMITMAALELTLERPYNELNDEEKQKIFETYIIVHAPPIDVDLEGGVEPDMYNNIEDSTEFHSAMDVWTNARTDIVSSVFQVVLLGFVIPKLDGEITWSWWLIFLPVWIYWGCSMCADCCGMGRSIKPVDEDEDFVIVIDEDDDDKGKETPDDMNEKKNGAAQSIDDVKDVKDSFATNSKLSESTPTTTFNTKSTNVKETVPSSMETKANDATAAPQETSEAPKTAATEASSNAEDKTPSPAAEETKEEQPDKEQEQEYIFLTEEEQAEADAAAWERDNPHGKTSVQDYSSSCCGNLWNIMIACLFVGKLDGDRDGDSYSAFWVIFPILFVVGICTCFLCCSIFCTPDPSKFDELHRQGNDSDNDDEKSNGPEQDAAAATNIVYAPPAVYAPPTETTHLKKDDDIEKGGYTTNGATDDKPKTKEAPTFYDSEDID